MNKTFRIVIILCTLIITMVAVEVPPSFPDDNLQQLIGLIDLRTTFSDGDYNIEELVLLAKQRGFNVLFINDHDRMAMEYGIPPLRNILRKRNELNSINKQGADRYIRAIQDAQKKYHDMIIIPGSETAPFYYWTGSIFAGSLTAHDHEKRLLTIGMENPKDYKNLPIIHNGLSLKYFQYFILEITCFSISLAAGILMICWRGRVRIIGIAISLLSIAFILNSDAFRSSRFDPYHGAQGIAPYQDFIDYVNSKDGMTFWNYPETKSGVRKMGPIHVSTLPYPDVIQESKSYTGFSAIYGDNITMTEPGNIWDITLREYCMGFRSKPPWGIATGDFHREGEGNDKLGNYQTVFFVENKSREAILAAMKKGKMYACQVAYPNSFKLDVFSVSSLDGAVNGISGDNVTMTGFPKVRIALSSKEVGANPVKVRLIRNGSVVYEFEEKLPLQIDYVDPYYKPGEKVFYRLDAKGVGKIVSNPIFVAFK